MFLRTHEGATVWAADVSTFREGLEAAFPVVTFGEIAWKEAVRRAKSEGLSLAGAQLDHMDLEGIDLRGVDLAGASLFGANLTAAWLDRARLTRANLTSAVLERARMSGSDLSWATLAGVRAGGAVLDHADLRYATLVDAHLEGARMRWANLVEVRLDGAAACGADFTGANLGRISAETADFTGCRFDEAIVFKSNLTQARIDPGALDRAVDGGATARTPEPLAGSVTSSPAADLLARLEGFFASEQEAAASHVLTAVLGFNTIAWARRQDAAFALRARRMSILEIVCEAAHFDREVFACLNSVFASAAHRER